MSITQQLNKTCFSLLFAFIVLNCCGQSINVEQLKKELNHLNGKERLVSLKTLSWELRTAENELAATYAKEGITLANNIADAKLLHEIQMNLGLIISYQGKYEEAIELIIPCLDYFQHEDFQFEKAKSLVYLSAIKTKIRAFNTADSLLVAATDILASVKNETWELKAIIQRAVLALRQKKYPIAHQLYQNALRKATKLKDISTKSTILSDLGLVEKKLHNYPTALSYYLEALRIAEDSLSISRTLNNISLVYQKLKDWDTALNYQEQSKAIKERLGLKVALANSWDNLGVIHKNRKDFGSALTCYQAALVIKKAINDKASHIGKTINNIGIIHLELDEFTAAINQFEEYLALATKNNNKEGICRAHFNLGQTYLEQGKYLSAIEQALISYTIATEEQDFHFLSISNELLANIYALTGDTDKYTIHYEAHKRISDSLLNLQTIREVALVEQQKTFDTYKKEIAAKNATIYKNKQATIGQKIIILGLSAALLLTIYLLYQSYIKNKNRSSKPYFPKTVSPSINSQTTLFSTDTAPDSAFSELKNLSGFLVEKLQTQEEWRQFEIYFTKIHPYFFKFLLEKHPAITSNELNHCALLRLNISNKEISKILGISPDSVRKAQHRLSKKMKLDAEMKLRKYILTV